MILRHDDPMAWDGAPSEEELHAEFLDWIWDHASPMEQATIQRERIRAARQRGDPRCPDCGGQRRSTCPVCAGAGFAEPALRPTTPTEEQVARRAAASAPGG
ncbi:MAG: hypothetical protein WCK70_03290 [Chloroflexales bacterium]